MILDFLTREKVLTNEDIHEALIRMRQRQAIKGLTRGIIAVGGVRVVQIATPVIDGLASDFIKSITLSIPKSPNIVRMGSNINLSYLGLGIVKGSTLILGAWSLVLLLLIPVVVGGLYNGKSILEVAFEVVLVILPLLFWGLC